MKILGIHGDYFNPDKEVYESNASVVVDGKIKAAIAEERISRVKLDGKFPFAAIEENLRVAGVDLSEIDEVVFATRSPKDNALAYLKCMFSTFSDTGVWIKNKSKVKVNLPGLLNSFVKSDKKKFSLKIGSKERDFNINFVDHHLSHAAGAYYGSPFDEALIITLDGGGNGLDGGAYYGSGTKLSNLFEVPHYQSPGTMYSAITHDLGFKRHRHEGKITGLAAYGKHDISGMGLTNLIKYSTSKHRFISPDIARHHSNLFTNSSYFHPILESRTREDLSATVQEIFEKVIIEYVADAIEFAGKKGYNPRNICLAGGCFANVKLNQRIFEIGKFENIFVFPAMGDEGLSAGAALVYYYNNSNSASKENSKLDDVYLGGSYTEKEMEDAIKKEKLGYEKFEEVEDEIARLLAEGKVIGRFNGGMEYGPRALGNRSIIGAPFDQSINDWLNEKLHRTEFMPFAPSIIEEKADEYLVGFSPTHKTADFMTITYDIKDGQKEKMPAVVHIDNTARPQIVKKDTNESYHKIIKKFGELTGVPVVLNTSFNIHEEPIVYSPYDAIRGFLGAKLDYLAMGPFIVKLPE